MSETNNSNTTTATALIQSNNKIDMKSSASERINHALNVLKMTPIESTDDHEDAMRKLQNILLSSGISYPVVSIQITAAEKTKATAVLRNPQLLLTEYDLYRKQSQDHAEEKENSKVNQDIVTPPETEDNAQAVLRAFPSSTDTQFREPHDILMHYFHQLKDQPGWKRNSEISRSKPYLSWESTYSYLIEYLLSLEISTSSLFIKGIISYFDSKNRYTTLPTSVHQILEHEKEQALTKFTKLFNDRNFRNKFKHAKDGPTDWELETQTVMKRLTALIKPNDENANYLGNIMAATKFEHCLSMLPESKALNTRLLLEFQKQSFKSVAEIDNAIDAWHYDFRETYSGTVVVHPDTKSNPQKFRRGTTHNPTKVETSKEQSVKTTNPPPGNGKSSNKSSKRDNPPTTPKAD